MRSKIHSVTQLLTGASSLSIMGTILRVGGSLFTLPIALRGIPEAQMGLYYLFLALQAMAMLLDFGFVTTIQRNAAYAMGGASEFVGKGLPRFEGNGSPNWDLLGLLQRAAQRWYHSLGVLLGTLLLTLGSFYISGQIGRESLPSHLFWCWLLVAVGTSLGFATSYWSNLLGGIGFVRKVAANQLTAQTISLLITIIGLLSGLGLWSYALAGFSAPMIGRYMSKRDFLRETQPVQTKINREQMFVVYRNLWPMAWRQGVVMIGAFLIQRGNTLVCSAKLGLSETASYGLTLNIINVILVTALMPLSLSWPTISRMRVQRDSAGIRRLFFKRLYLGLAVAACGIVFLALVGPWGLAWLGSDTKLLPAGVILVLGLVYLLEQHHSNYAILVLTENQNPFLIPGLLSGIAIIIFAWFIGGNYGVIGIILVQGLIQLLWNNWWTVVRGIKSL